MRINPQIFELTIEQQNEIQQRLEYDEYLSKRHNSLVHYMNEYHQSPLSYRSIDDPDYRKPSIAEIQDIVEHLVTIHSRSLVSKMIGTSIKTVDKWCSGETVIPYPAWRLLLVLSGRVTQFNRIPSSTGVHEWKKYYRESAKHYIRLDVFNNALNELIKHAGDSRYTLRLDADELFICNSELDEKRGNELINCSELKDCETVKRILNKRLYAREIVKNGVKTKILLTSK